MSKRKTTEEFIRDAIKIHGNKYDYSKVEYIKNDSEVIITCPEHGDFKQTPNKHLLGRDINYVVIKEYQSHVLVI